MKRFKYSLQKILDLRAFQLKQAEIELGKVNAQIAAIDSQLKEIAQEKITIEKNMDATHDMQLFASGHNYIVFLNQKREQCLSQRAILQIEADKRKEVVRQAMQKEKVLDRLKDNKLASWKEAGRKEEELIVDDVVTAKYNKAQ